MPLLIKDRTIGVTIFRELRVKQITDLIKAAIRQLPYCLNALLLCRKVTPYGRTVYVRLSFLFFEKKRGRVRFYEKDTARTNHRVLLYS